MMKASGSGTGHGACAFWAIFEIVCGIGIIVFSSWLASEYGVTQEVRAFGQTFGGGKNEMYNYFMIMGWVYGLFCFVCAILMPVAISKTRIAIYDDKVEGVGVSKYFLWGDPRTSNFMYPINQVSIDVNGGKLVVHGQNTVYCVYVKNGSEIQNALWEAKKSSSVSGSNTTSVENVPDYWVCRNCNVRNPNTLIVCTNCRESR